MECKSTPPGHFYILDVFAESKYVGNQLAVFTPSRIYESEEMQLLAREMHFSETTFITSPEQRDGGYDVRIFTPEEELPFAGHPTLGTSFAIRELLLDTKPDEVKLNLGVGQIPVRWESSNHIDLPFMTQATPNFFNEVDVNVISNVLDLDIHLFDTRCSPQIVSTGIPFCIVPFKDLRGVQACTPRTFKISELDSTTPPIGVLIFSTETLYKENQIHARVFTGLPSVPEDPATGSANGCLAAYLIEKKFFGNDKIDVRVEQGFEMQRPSILHLCADYISDRIEVKVGGNVILIAEGVLK